MMSSLRLESRKTYFFFPETCCSFVLTYILYTYSFIKGKTCMIMIKWHSMAKFEVNNLLGGNSIT